MIQFLALLIPVTQEVIILEKIPTVITIVDRPTSWNSNTRRDELVLGNRTTGIKVIGDDFNNSVTTFSNRTIEFDLGNGNNTLYTGRFGTGEVVATTGNGRDYIALFGASRAIVDSGAGDDVITITTGRASGGDGNDTIQSLNGGSILSGGAGTNLMISAAGRSDTIVLDRNGRANISNFQPGLTKISLNGIPLPELEITGGTIKVNGNVIATAGQSFSVSDFIE